MTVEVADDTDGQVFNLPAPKPGLLAHFATSYAQGFQPKHFLGQFHPDINPDADAWRREYGFENGYDAIAAYYGNSDWTDTPTPMLRKPDIVSGPAQGDACRRWRATSTCRHHRGPQAGRQPLFPHGRHDGPAAALHLAAGRALHQRQRGAHPQAGQRRGRLQVAVADAGLRAAAAGKPGKGRLHDPAQARDRDATFAFNVTPRIRPSARCSATCASARRCRSRSTATR
jgi:hypothetical protein